MCIGKTANSLMSYSFDVKTGDRLVKRHYNPQVSYSKSLSTEKQR